MTQRRTPAKKAEEVEVNLTQDQTRDEAEEAAALVAEHELKEAGGKIPDQTEGEAQLANAIAEDFTAVPDDSKDQSVEGTQESEDAPSGKKFEVEVLVTGLMVQGRVLTEGSIVAVPEEIWNQSKAEQEKVYGFQYFKKA